MVGMYWYYRTSIRNRTVPSNSMVKRGIGWCAERKRDVPTWGPADAN